MTANAAASDNALNAYIDESGDEGFTRLGWRAKGVESASTEWLVLGAVVVPSEVDAERTAVIEELRKVLNRTNSRKPLHWRDLRNDHSRKRRAMDLLAQQRFKYSAVALRKPPLEIRSIGARPASPRRGRSAVDARTIGLVTRSRPPWADEIDASPATRWVRCALQVNPFAYVVRHGVATEASDETAYNATLVRALINKGVALIAVTDHFGIAESVTLLAAARDAGIVALPGFEASTVEGLHFLVIFEADTSPGDIERCIGKCDVRDVGTPSPHSGISALGLLELCADTKAACVAAHVTHDNGVLEHATGQARVAIWTSEHLHAVAIPGAIERVPERHQAILNNADRRYARPQLPAVLNAADICSPASVQAPGASCQIRMSSPSQAALRHALLDPESRVQLDSDAVAPPRPRLVAIHWDGGLLDGQTIPLAEELNVMIGAPGAGKSTVIESLRSAFELSPSSERAREDHKAILEKVLRNGTVISVVLDHPQPTPVRYVVERRLPNPPVVRLADDWTMSNRAVGDLTPIPQIYGQHEIADLAADPVRRTDLLQRFVGRRDARQADYEGVISSLERSRARVDESVAEVEQLQAELSLLPGAKERLKLFEDAKVTERLAEQTLLDREKRVIDRASEVLEGLSAQRDDFLGGLPDEDIGIDDAVQHSLFIGELQLASDAIKKPIALVATQAAELQSEIAAAQTVVDEVLARWKLRRGEADSALQAVKAQLEAESIDHEMFREVQGRVDALLALEPRMKAAIAARDKATADRRALIVKRESLESEIVADLRKAARRVSGLLAPSVRIEVDVGVDHERVGIALKTAGGRLNEALTIFRNDADFSPRALVEVAREGSEPLETRWGLPAQQAAKIASLPRLEMLELEEMPLLITTAIELNTAPEGTPPTWTSIEQLSHGQQAIAVLLLLLLDSDAPLIVDQPEDDLDNRFISSRVVPAVRAAKHRRQFLFSTHNANVPVLADAELVIGLSATDADQRRAQVRPEHLGGVDTQSVRALIEQRLEGGRDAFESRRRRYRLD